MPDNSQRLLKLAETEFPDLSDAEKAVLAAAGTGDWADLAQWEWGPPDPRKKKFNPGGGRLRSALVTWLCTDTRAKRLVHRKGLRIVNASLDVELDLERAEIPFFFGLRSCRLPGLSAARATLRDNLYLKSCRVDGEVNLNGATISGQFQCQGARFFNKGGYALDADRATFSSYVFLSRDFRAVGEVRLLGAKIAGQLDCEGGSFRNPKGKTLRADNAPVGGRGDALNAANSTIGNHTFLHHGFRAVGEVCLLGAKITGQLVCEGGSFRNPEGNALNADGVSIGSDVFLSDGFRAVGEVRLPGAKIAGQLDCKGGRFLNPKGHALNADGATIGSDVFLSQGFRAKGEVLLLGAKITGQLDCKGGSFLNRKGDALYAANATIGSDIFLSVGFRSVGEVCLLRATITGQLACDDGKFINPKGFALNLEHAIIHGSIHLDPKNVHGIFHLFRTVTQKTLRMLAPTLATASLNLSGAKVGLLYDAVASWPEQGKLQLDGFHYDSIDCDSPMTARERLDWLDRQRKEQNQDQEQDQNKFLPQPYEALAAFFQRTGHDSFAKDVRMAKEDARTRQWYGCCDEKWRREVVLRSARWLVTSDLVFACLPTRLCNLLVRNAEGKINTTKPTKLLYKEPAKRVWWWIKRWTVGYGYKPYFAVKWFGWLVVIGSIVFMLGMDSMTPTVSYDFKATQHSGIRGELRASDYPDFNSLAYSLDVALPIVDLQQERYWMPNSSTRLGWWLWLFNWAEVLAGWFLASMGIAGATGIIRKD